MDTAPRTTFADHLRYYRLRAGVTQVELASRSGVSERAIRDMERGRVPVPQKRSADALARSLRLDPVETRSLHAAAGHGGPAEASASRSRVLPSPIADLVGRAADSAWVRAQVTSSLAAPTMRVALLHGLPGVGKTTLALHAAHAVEAEFPDGAVFVDAQGMDAEPLPPTEAIRLVLTALGVVAADVPGDPGGRLDLYRRLMRTRGVLLVVDNVVDEAQVRPLLAAGAGSLMLVTSRSTLAGLALDARREVDVLSPAESVELLAVITGGRTAIEPEATAEVARLCDGVPLALRIAGSRVFGTGQPVARLAGQLEDDRHRLTRLQAGDQQVRAAFDLSYRLLGPDAAAAFRRLSLVPGPAFGTDLAAVVADLPFDRAYPAIAELADASLLRATDDPDRYAFHDLMRLFARERLHEVDGSDRAAESARVMSDWLLRRAIAAATLHAPDVVASPDVEALFADVGAAEEWLRVELPQWRGAFLLAVAAGRHREVLDLAHAMHWYSDQHGTGELWLEVFGAGADAARALDSPADEAVQENFLTWTTVHLLGRPEDALVNHRRALEIAERVGDPVQQGWACAYRSSIEARVVGAGEAVPWARRAVDLFAKAGHETGHSVALSNLGQRLMAAGRHPEAAEVYWEAIRLQRLKTSDNVGDRRILAWHLIRVARFQLETGDLDETHAVLDEAELLLGPDAVGGLKEARFCRGMLLKATGDTEDAREVLGDLVDRDPIPTDGMRALIALVELCEQARLSDLAREYRVRAVALYTSPGVRLPLEQRPALAAFLGIPVDEPREPREWSNGR
ncbi:ATP-binding protein [Umezawaea sp. NPDC059074]|uniref:ATP-binding protein n=1 Tax=Umezawaea sp. NPDC059074 TaxID=3346716 RepID=UPI0036BD9E57